MDRCRWRQHPFGPKGRGVTKSIGTRWKWPLRYGAATQKISNNLCDLCLWHENGSRHIGPLGAVFVPHMKRIPQMATEIWSRNTKNFKQPVWHWPWTFWPQNGLRHIGPLWFNLCQIWSKFLKWPLRYGADTMKPAKFGWFYGKGRMTFKMKVKVKYSWHTCSLLWTFVPYMEGIHHELWELWTGHDEIWQNMFVSMTRTAGNVNISPTSGNVNISRKCMWNLTYSCATGVRWSLFIETSRTAWNHGFLKPPSPCEDIKREVSQSLTSRWYLC